MPVLPRFLHRFTPFCNSICQNSAYYSRPSSKSRLPRLQQKTQLFMQKTHKKCLKNRSKMLKKRLKNTAKSNRTYSCV